MVFFTCQCVFIPASGHLFAVIGLIADDMAVVQMIQK